MFHNTRMRKMDAAALIANFAIDELVIRSSRSGDIRDYYDIAVVQYSGDGVEIIISDGEGAMMHINGLQNIMPQPVCYNIAQQGEESDEESTEEHIPLTLHEWVKPKAYGIAPMYEALVYIKDVLYKWCKDRVNRNSFPPMVINITDGCSSDAEQDELLDIANQLKNIGTKDGSTLLINIQLTDENSEHCQSMLFPPVSEELEHDDDGQLLYEMSSILPPTLEPVTKEIVSSQRRGPYKCFARNASICEILAITDIGTDSCYKYSLDV